MNRYFAKGSLRRRVVALTAAYAIVLSSLFANLGAARAAVGDPVDPWSVICHSVGAEHPSPAGDEGNSKTCVNGCCIGCLMLLATEPAAPLEAVLLPLDAGQILKPLTTSELPVRRERKSHLSRGPPLGA